MNDMFDGLQVHFRKYRTIIFIILDNIRGKEKLLSVLKIFSLLVHPLLIWLLKIEVYFRQHKYN